MLRYCRTGFYDNIIIHPTWKQNQTSPENRTHGLKAPFSVSLRLHPYKQRHYTMQGAWPTSRKLCIIPKSLTSPSPRTYVTFSHSHKMPNLAFIYPTKTSLKLALFTAKLLQTLSDPLSTSSQPHKSTLFNYCKPRSHDPPLFVLLFSPFRYLWYSTHAAEPKLHTQDRNPHIIQNI